MTRRTVSISPPKPRSTLTQARRPEQRPHEVMRSCGVVLSGQLQQRLDRRLGWGQITDLQHG